jgi:hypothetical protein
MTITNDEELQSAEDNLAALQKRYGELLAETSDDPGLHDVMLTGVKQAIHSLTIEISRYNVIKLARK